MRRTLMAMIGLALLGAPAYAVTVDFDSLAPGTYTEAQFNAMLGATFNNTTGNQFDVVAVVDNPLNPDFSPRNAVLNQNYFTPPNSTQVFFSTLVSFVSVTMGDFDQDSDNLYLRAYNSSNVLVGSDFYANPSSSYDGHTLSVTAPDIAWIEFWGEGVSHNSVYWDNLSWEPVPEPSTLLLLGGGLLLYRRARRGRAARG